MSRCIPPRAKKFSLCTSTQPSAGRRSRNSAWCCGRRPMPLQCAAALMASGRSALQDAADDALARRLGDIQVLIGVAALLRQSRAHMTWTGAVILAGLGDAVTFFNRGVVGGQDCTRAQGKEAANRGREHDSFRIHLGSSRIVLLSFG